ncbi:U6 snRNA-associated Sm-like protein LSm4 [Trichomonascus vanleenenianus]|uniref:U6 snRNA-associated Sm-like protein LSm4 n=1 Tax=Trichomonascus vanleenenianus TaxID=2268995 RepID=UPI003EC9DFD8
MLPLSLLNAAQGQPLMVELKSGETLNGHLINCDTWMNLTLKEVVQTSADGKSFQKVPQTYVRGNIIKYLQIPDELIDHIKEERQNRDNRNQRYNNQRGNFRGGRSNPQNQNRRQGDGSYNRNRNYGNRSNPNTNNNRY